MAEKIYPGNIPRLDELGMDYRVLLFTFGISILTGVVFGLAPALRASRVDLNTALKAGGRSSTSDVLRVRRDKRHSGRRTELLRLLCHNRRYRQLLTHRLNNLAAYAVPGRRGLRR